MKTAARFLTIALFIFFAKNTAVAQGIAFPIGHNGIVWAEVIENMLEVRGIVETEEPPPWEEIISYTPVPCAKVELIDKWDCANPERHGTRSLFFYYLFQVFDEFCDTCICFFKKNEPQWGEVCICNDWLKLDARAWITDICDDEVNMRLPGHMQFLDKEERIVFHAELRNDKCRAQFPNTVVGVVNGCCQIDQRFELHRIPDPDSCRAEYYYVGENVRFFTDCGTGGNMTFFLNIKRTAYYSTYADEVEFTIEDLSFKDTLVIAGCYLPLTVCLAPGEPLTFGTEISTDVWGWPVDCQTMIGRIYGRKDTTIIISTADTILQNCFTTPPETSSFHGLPYFHYKNLTLNWKAQVDIGPLRNAKPLFTTLHIIHAFRADSVKITSHHPDSIDVGDSVRVEACNSPFLVDQLRLKYDWRASGPPGGGHFRFAHHYYRHNFFIATRPGTYTIYYTLTDTVSGFGCTVLRNRAIVVKPPELKIDSPRKDTTFWISDVPQMPEIKCRAHIAGPDSAAQESLQFNWRIEMEFNDLSLARMGSAIGVCDWIPNFAEDFGGGYVSLDAGAKFGSDSLTAHYVTVDSIKILGTNPAETTIRVYLIDGYQDPDRARQAEVIGQMESGYRQFINTGPMRGFPLVSGDGGVGIMQITNPPPERSDYWNWHTNVDTGKEILENKWTASNQWFNARVAEGWPQPTNDNLLFDTYCRFNGGRYYSAVISQGDSIYVRNIMWINSCGICNPNNSQADEDTLGNCSQSGCCYADDAMAIH